jgi:hypothetical protein
VVPILGTRWRRYLEENVAAADVARSGRGGGDPCRGPRDAVAGDRYGQEELTRVGL